MSKFKVCESVYVLSDRVFTQFGESVDDIYEFIELAQILCVNSDKTYVIDVVTNHNNSLPDRVFTESQIFRDKIKFLDKLARVIGAKQRFLIRELQRSELYIREVYKIAVANIEDLK